MIRHVRPSLLRRAAFAVALAVPLAACGSRAATPVAPTTQASTAPSTAASAEAPTNVAGIPGYPDGCPTAQPAPLASGEERNVTIATDKGDIVIDVKADLSPIAAGNFVELADCGFYDGVVFHRVVDNFVIQGGDGQYGRSPSVDAARVGSGGPPYTIQDEPVTATYGRGTVAMARTPDPDSVGSQFFIVTSDEARASLEAANTYQIIGNVTSGMDVVDEITAAANHVEIPADPVVMNKVTVATP
jgi:cyclophilin family peptidyl-prolyl cis-trans isomerase